MEIALELEIEILCDLCAYLILDHQIVGIKDG